MKTRIDLGRAWIDPGAPVVAGSFTTVTYTYMAGHPVDDSGHVKIAFRQMGDFGTPQFSDSVAPNHCVVRTTGDCSIEPRWDPKGHERPWSGALYLRVHKGFLAAGERIVVVFGETSGGSPGWQMQTFCEVSFEFKSFVDPIATARFHELPESPVLRIVPGPAVKAVCIAPSNVPVDVPITSHLRLEDRWGNAVASPRRTTHPGFRQPGVENVNDVDTGTGLGAESNPIRVVHTISGLQSFWADFHGQSEETIGTNSIEDYFTFARDVALVDIAGHQGNDFQITDGLWHMINDVTARFNEPGHFIAFPGYEWSGNTPLGGDRNVCVLNTGAPPNSATVSMRPGFV